MDSALSMPGFTCIGQVMEFQEIIVSYGVGSHKSKNNVEISRWKIEQASEFIGLCPSFPTEKKLRRTKEGFTGVRLLFTTYFSFHSWISPWDSVHGDSPSSSSSS